MKKTVYIYGGCMTRDVFVRAGMSSFKVEKYYARTVPASIAQKPFSILEEEEASTFATRAVYRDTNKSFLEIFDTDLTFDYLIMDLASASYMKLFELNGNIGTLSPYARTVLDQKGIAYNEIPCWSGEYKAYHNEGMALFVQRVTEKNITDKLIVNRFYSTYKYIDGVERRQKFSMNVNQILNEMYSDIEKNLPNIHFIDYPEELLIGDVNHKWGISLFHFTDAFYQHQEEQLKKIMVE